MSSVGESEASTPAFELGNTEIGKAFIWNLTEDNPTKAEDCVFCDAPERQEEISAFDIAIPMAKGKVAIKAALGMLRTGYMLGVTREHITSFAQLTPESLTEVDEAFNELEARLAVFSEAGYIRLEHGSDDVDACGLGAGACVVHAHQHLIPDNGATFDRMSDDRTDWRELKTYADLNALRGKPYLYIGSKDTHLVASDPQVVSQWGRRVVAGEDGHEEWDWAASPGSVNFLQTFLSLGLFPQGRVVLNEFGATFTQRDHPRGEGMYK